MSIDANTDFPEDHHSTAIPGHVASKSVYDFDVLHPPGFQDDIHLAWKQLHLSAPDIFWTPRNGGHWVATRAEDIEFMQRNVEIFSHRAYGIPRDPNFPGTPPADSDAPEHGPFRALIAPAFVPRAIQGLEKVAREVAISTIESLKPAGECEFISGFAQVLPIAVFLKTVNLPFEDRKILLPLTGRAARAQSIIERQEAIFAMRDYLFSWTEQRRSDPGDDVISTIVNGKINGRDITKDEALAVCTTLLFGGLDTVTAMMGFFMRFLAANPSHRRELQADLKLIPRAIEELIRRFGVANTARELTRDFEYKGVLLKQGDQIQLPNSMVGLDERSTADPLEVNFRRPGSVRHAAFGNGVHVCPGAVLARRELGIFVEEWIRRIPEFAIKPATKPVLATGVINTVLSLELCWPH